VLGKNLRTGGETPAAAGHSEPRYAFAYIAAASGIHCLAAFHRAFAAMLAWHRRAAGSCARSGGMHAPVLAGFEG